MWDLGVLTPHTEAHAHNEIRGPVGETGNSNGSGLGPWLKSSATMNYGWGLAHPKRPQSQRMAVSDAQVGHPGQSVLLRMREGRKASWAVLGPQRKPTQG